MKSKKRSNKAMIIFMTTIYAISIIISLQAGTLMSKDIYLDYVSAFAQAGSQIVSGKISIFPIASQSFVLIGAMTFLFIIAILWLYVEKEKKANLMRGNEHGSGKWNTDLKAYNKKYTDPPFSIRNDGPYNMILTNDVKLNMNTWITKRNNNVVVIGGSGSGKSRYFVKPNILQYNCSYVITDPAGELLETQGKGLIENGYKIKVFNLVDMKHSNCYNPFNYIRDDLGVIMLINCLIKNTTPPGQKSGDPFWEKSETALLQALMFYLIKYRPKHEQNFTSVMKLIRAAEIDENDPNAESPLDSIFKMVARKDPTSIALKQYMAFKIGTGKTLKSILISCSVRLAVFNMKEIENLTGRDDIDLKTIGDEKQALFVIIPAADDTYNFLVSMMYSQLFETLYYHAEHECEGKRLKSHVRFLLDEFANIGQIPDFTKKLSTMRKYEISCSIILQNLAQLKAMYKDDWEGIIGNCDSFLFLGGQEYSTLEYISKELGDATITIRSTGRSRGKSGSSSQNFSRSARKLMTPDEIMTMDEDSCILMIRAMRPFFGKKYKYTKHPNYSFTGDYDSKKLYICSDHYNNEKKPDFNELTVEVTKKSLDFLNKTKDLELVEDEIIGKPKIVDIDLMKELNIDTPEELPNKFVKRKSEIEPHMNNIGSNEVWEMNMVD